MKYDLKYQLITLLFICITMGLFAQTSIQYDNLGKKINTEWTETAPVISADGHTLYFVRDRHPDNDCQQAIWYSELLPDSTWSEAKRMDKPFNTEKNNSISSASVSGNTLLIPNAYFRGDYVGKGYSLTHKTIKGWTKFERLIIKGYDDMDNGDFAFGYLSADQTKLIMSFSPTGSNSNNDLYISFKKDENNWTTPVALGVNINSKHNEITPYLAADDITLYFSSNTTGGHGSYDVYRCRRLDNTYTRWSDPVNVGPQFNSKKGEAYFTIDAKGEYAYLSSSTNSIGKKDIVKIKIPTIHQPKPIALLAGKVTNKKGEPVHTTVLYELLSTGKLIGQAETNPNNGEYKVVLPLSNQYCYTTNVKKHFPTANHIDLGNIQEYTEIEASFQLQATSTKESIPLNNVFFGYNSATVLNKSFPELDRLHQLLVKRKRMKIEITSHTSKEGNKNYNQKLSEQRALSVKTYLVQKGILETRIRTQGYSDVLKTQHVEKKGIQKIIFKVI